MLVEVYLNVGPSSENCDFSFYLSFLDEIFFLHTDISGGGYRKLGV